MAARAKVAALPAVAPVATSSAAPLGYDSAQPDGCAPLGTPVGTQEQQDQEEWCAAEAAAPDSNGDGEESQSNFNGGRENDQKVGSDSETSRPPSPSGLQDEPDSGKVGASDEPDKPDGRITAEIIGARDALMFVAGAAEPTTSGLGACAALASNEMLSLVWKHAQKMPKARMAVLSRSFGNFDMIVAAGWLLGDLVRGTPILERGQAHTIGLKIKYEARKVEKNVAKIRLEAKRAAGRAGVTEAARLKLLEDAEKNVETLLRAAPEAELPWPAAAQPAARKRKRKRTREAASSHEEQLAALDAKQLKAERQAERAAAALERADAKERQKQKVAERMLDQVDRAQQELGTLPKKAPQKAKKALMARWSRF